MRPRIWATVRGNILAVKRRVELLTPRPETVIVAVSAVSILLVIAMILLATQFRPIADDYFHIGRVMEMGVLGSTADWYRTLLPGFVGVLLMSIFAAPFGVVPDYLAYIPYTTFVVAVLYFLGVTLLKPFLTSHGRSFILLLASAIPPLWLLSMANVFPEYDVINTFGMLSWISNGYRLHLPILLLIFFLWMNWWRFSKSWGIVISGLGMLLLTLSFLNPLPDIAAYFVLCAGSSLFFASQSKRNSKPHSSTRAAINASMALGVLGGLTFLLLSPGTTSRIDAKPLQFTLESALLSVPYQLQVFLREMTNVSHLVVLIGVFGLALLAAHQLTTQQIMRCLIAVRYMTLTTLFLTGLLLFTGIMGETLTYNAIFHRWMVLQMQFVAIVLIGFWAALWWISTRDKQIPLPIAGVATGVALLIAIIPMVRVYDLATERRQVWETGQPAPISYMVDREQLIFQEWWDKIRPSAPPIN